MCDCRKRVNDELAQHNTRLTPLIQILSDGSMYVMIAVATEKIDSHKRGGPVHLAAAYCPFCGGKYQGD